MFLRKTRKILEKGVRLLKKRGAQLTERDRLEFEADLRALDKALLSQDKNEARRTGLRVQSFCKTHFPKRALDHAKEVVYALTFALVVAFFIRQFWFELYQVPTGSMRPTIEEKDRLVVSRTTFGLKIPFITPSLFFHETLIKRAGIIVFTTLGMDVPDKDMLYFGLFPGKKRFVKRAIGKPGDTLYFYGGRVYGIDREGNPISELASPSFLEENRIKNIEHVPYIHFDGKTEVSRPLSHRIYSEVTLKQMNLPLGKMELNPEGEIEGKFFNGKEWVKDNPNALKASHDHPVSYSELFGIGNYAMARLLTKEQAIVFYGEVPKDSETPLYLELHHTPNLTFPKPEMRQGHEGRIHPMITPSSTLIPLSTKHLDALLDQMTTSRFYVKQGKAYRYIQGGKRPQRVEYDPPFPGVPDGCYEFEKGTLYKIHLGGIRTKPSASHSLYSKSSENIQKLFNLGLQFNRVFDPVAPYQPYVPQRFAYYRDGDLRVMDAPILKKHDPVLVRFIQNEIEKEQASSREAPYIAFIDRGPPLKNGELVEEFIEAFGLHIPDDGVLALGDNYAMSSDSRDFGFVPTKNLLGSPSFIFWPPTGRLGPLAQPPYPWITPQNILVAIVVVCIALICFLYARKRNQKSLFDD